MDRQLQTAQPFTIVERRRPDPAPNRLSTKIHEAAQQFDAVNPHLVVANVLAFVNHDHGSDFEDICQVVTGVFRTRSGQRDPIYRRFSEGRIRDEKKRIHLYIWKDDFRGDGYLFNAADPGKMEALCRYFGIDLTTIQKR